MPTLKTRAAVAGLVALVSLAACDRSAKPYLEIEGGGFIFNYRIAEAFYGVALSPTRPLPEGARIVGRFEDPAGGPPLTVVLETQPRTLRYTLRSPAVRSVVAGRPYRLDIRLEDAAGQVLEEQVRDFTSDVDQGILPPSPLTTGPGYARPPAGQAAEPPAPR